VSIESGNHLALLAGDGRIDDAAFIKDNAAEQVPDFDFTILTNSKGEKMAEDNLLPPEQSQPPIDDDSMYATKDELARVEGLVNQILEKIATAEGKQAATPPVAPSAGSASTGIVPSTFPINLCSMRIGEPLNNSTAAANTSGLRKTRYGAARGGRFIS